MIEIPLTKYILEHGIKYEDELSSRAILGDVCQVSIKLLFNKDLLRTDLHDSDSVLGISNLRTDYATECFIKLGYFNTRIMQIIHGVVQKMRVGEVCQISFELDPNELDESLKTNEKSGRVFLDLKFELEFIGKGKSL